MNDNQKANLGPCPRKARSRVILLYHSRPRHRFEIFFPLSDTDSPVPTAGERRRHILVPLIVGCAFFMEGLDSTMGAVSIPAMASGRSRRPGCGSRRRS
jgi:hypothetical protein